MDIQVKTRFNIGDEVRSAATHARSFQGVVTGIAVRVWTWGGSLRGPHTPHWSYTVRCARPPATKWRRTMSTHFNRYGSDDSLELVRRGRSR